MPRIRAPRVINDELKDSEYPAPIVIGRPFWFEWLDSHESFHFENQKGKFTAVKTRGYWTAHRRVKGKLYRHYLGVSQDLTLDKLCEAAEQISTAVQNVPLSLAKQSHKTGQEEIDCETDCETEIEKGNEISEYRELLNESRRIAIQRESDFNRLMAQKVEVCKENQELKHQLELLHTQVGNNNQQAQLRAELEAANEQIAQLKASDTASEGSHTTARCYSAEQITLEVIQAVIHDKNWQTPIERHRQDPKTNVRYWALVKLLDELGMA